MKTLNEINLVPYLKNKKIKPQMILVPLVAYDNIKNRLGYGKGFYDRFLNKIEDKKNLAIFSKPDMQ